MYKYCLSLINIFLLSMISHGLIDNKKLLISKRQYYGKAVYHLYTGIQLGLVR